MASVTLYEEKHCDGDLDGDDGFSTEEEDDIGLEEALEALNLADSYRELVQ